MKNVLLKTLIYGLAPIVLLVASYFPFLAIYSIAIQMRYLDLMEYDMGHSPLVEMNTLRLKITLIALVVAVVLVGLSLLLYWLSKRQKLVLFKRVFKTAVYYVSILTVLMLAGLWLDYKGEIGYLKKVDPSTGEVVSKPAGVSVRVGFIFYISHPFKVY